jgi:uncharacterized protein (TIGR00251 family)
MSPRTFRLHDGKKGAAVAVRLTPRASRNEIVEIMHDGTIKVHVTAAPVDGDANEALLAFLAEVLGIAKSRLDIVAGLKGRDKLISILDMDSDSVHRKIVEHLG